MTQRKVPIAVFGQPVPDWYRDLLISDEGYHSIVEKRLDEDYKALVEASKVSMTELDAKIAYALTTHYDLAKRAEAAFLVVLLHNTVAVHHENRKVVDKIGGRILDVIHAHPPTALKFYTQIISGPGRLSYGRMAGMKGGVAEEYLQYAAFYATVYPNQHFATYEDASNAVQTFL
jgi:hypothetical protein